MAASANGTVTVVLPHGAIRTSLAEMAGVDLRGLGLMLEKSTEQTEVRCGVAAFDAHQGVLSTQRLVIDTDPVLITGDGEIQLGSEDLEIALRGHPKSPRLLRLHAPVLVRGTLAHPAIQIEPHHLTLVDPGRAKDADCGALLSAAAGALELGVRPPRDGSTSS